MFIKKTTKTVKDKTYENYVLLETIYTPQSPRQKTVCSLGSLSGQMTFEGDDETVKGIVEHIRRKKDRPPRVPPVEPPPGDGLVIPVVVDKTADKKPKIKPPCVREGVRIIRTIQSAPLQIGSNAGHYDISPRSVLTDP